MKKILLLGSKGGPTTKLEQTTAALNKLITSINKHFAFEYDVFSNLQYSIIDKNSHIYSAKHEKDLLEYDLVVFLVWQRSPEQATSCQIYLENNNANYIFTETENIRSHSKLSEYFRLWEYGLPIPNTIYSKNVNLVKMAKQEKLKFPLILKEAFLHRGKLNFLVHSIEELKTKLKDHKGKRFIVQEFIPNNFDYRIIVLGGKPKVVLQRTRNNKTHLNNTSQGAKSKKIPLKNFNYTMLKNAAKAASIMKRSIAGVDIIINSKNKKHYILEVNYSPNISEGSTAMKELYSYLVKKCDTSKTSFKKNK